MKNQIVSQLKSMIEEITTLESKKYNINMNTSGYTILDYLNVEALQKKLSFQKKSLFLVKALTNFERINGYYDNEEKIVILLKNKMYKSNDVAQVVFHECRHCYQSTANNYIEFIFDIETLLIHINKNLYHKYHDIFFIEIDANKYGYKNAVDYLSKYNILSEKKKKEYGLILQLHDNYLNGYNSIYMFNLLNSYLKNKSNNEWFKKIYTNCWLKEIYNESGMMKNYKEILQSSYFQSLDECTQNIIMTSYYFLENMDVHSLNEKEQEMLLRAINYANQIKEKNDKQNFEIVKKTIKMKINPIKVIENIMYQKKLNFCINKEIQSYLSPILEQLNQELLHKNIGKK